MKLYLVILSLALSIILFFSMPLYSFATEEIGVPDPLSLSNTDINIQYQFMAYYRLAGNITLATSSTSPTGTQTWDRTLTMSEGDWSYAAINSTRDYSVDIPTVYQNNIYEDADVTGLIRYNCYWNWNNRAFKFQISALPSANPSTKVFFSDFSRTPNIDSVYVVFVMPVTAYDASYTTFSSSDLTGIDQVNLTLQPFSTSTTSSGHACINLDNPAQPNYIISGHSYSSSDLTSMGLSYDFDDEHFLRLLVGVVPLRLLLEDDYILCWEWDVGLHNPRKTNDANHFLRFYNGGCVITNIPLSFTEQTIEAIYQELTVDEYDNISGDPSTAPPNPWLYDDSSDEAINDLWEDQVTPNAQVAFNTIDIGFNALNFRQIWNGFYIYSELVNSAFTNFVWIQPVFSVVILFIIISAIRGVRANPIQRAIEHSEHNNRLADERKAAEAAAQAKADRMSKGKPW